MTTTRASPWRSWPLPWGVSGTWPDILTGCAASTCGFIFPATTPRTWQVCASCRQWESTAAPISGNGGTDWEALADLATYAVLERTPHAAMEPFAFMVANYPASHRLDWGRVIFDDPRHFLHLDEAGRVALSQAELAEGRFVAHNLSEIEAPEEFPPIRERLRSWRHYFVDNHPCASCGGWRICLGKFSQDLAAKAGCSEFFLEMIDLVRQHTALQVAPEERRIWQP